MSTQPFDQAIFEKEMEQLLKLPQSVQIERLGMRQIAIQNAPSLAADVALSPVYDARSMGPLDGVKELGRAILVKWAKELQELVCGDGAAADRAKLRDAFGIGKTGGGMLIATGLIAVGCAPAIAAVVGAIVMTRFVDTGWEVFCAKSKGWVDALN